MRATRGFAWASRPWLRCHWRALPWEVPDSLGLLPAPLLWSPPLRHFRPRLACLQLRVLLLWPVRSLAQARGSEATWEASQEGWRA